MADGWEYLKAQDTISGKEGTLYATIDGNIVAVAELTNINAKITKNKKEIKVLGHRGTQYKATGWTGTGQMTIHYVTSMWSKMMLKYVDEGKDTYFKLQCTNEDPTSSAGKQTVTLLDVNLDEDEIIKLDTEADTLDKQMNFTFSDVTMTEAFSIHDDVKFDD